MVGISFETPDPCGHLCSRAQLPSGRGRYCDWQKAKTDRAAILAARRTVTSAHHARAHFQPHSCGTIVKTSQARFMIDCQT